MMHEAAVGIAAAEARTIVEETEGGVTEKLKAAMCATKDHWFATSEYDQLHAAIVAVIEFYGCDSKEGLTLAAETRHMNKVNKALQAASAGVIIDIESLANEEPGNTVGIMNLWRESKGT